MHAFQKEEKSKAFCGYSTNRRKRIKMFYNSIQGFARTPNSVNRAKAIDHSNLTDVRFAFATKQSHV